MKRIAVITFCHRDLLVNYGQTLQSFALQKILSGYGFEVLTVSYRRRHLPAKEAYIQEYTNPSLRDMKSKGFAKTTAFVEQNMKCVQAYGENDVYSATKDADILICGSDAIWRAAHYDSTFYLDIRGSENKLKIAYAPSFLNFIEEDIDIYCNMGRAIRNINYISTREEQGVKLLEDVCGINGAKAVLDPTLLWKGEDWEKYMSLNLLPKPYIILYLLNDTNEYDNLIQKVWKRYHVGSMLSIYTGSTLPGRTYIEEGVGPDDFLALIAGATAVVTNSYHGVVFSLIFHKEVYIFKRTDSIVKDDFRFTNLYGICNIQSRVITSEEDFKNIEESDWECIDDNLASKRKESMDFLTNAVYDSEKRTRTKYE